MRESHPSAREAISLMNAIWPQYAANHNASFELLLIYWIERRFSKEYDFIHLEFDGDTATRTVSLGGNFAEACEMQGIQLEATALAAITAVDTCLGG